MHRHANRGCNRRTDCVGTRRLITHSRGTCRPGLCAAVSKSTQEHLPVRHQGIERCCPSWCVRAEAVPRAGSQSPIDLRDFRAPHRTRAERAWVQPNRLDPIPDQSSILPRRDMYGLVEPARPQELQSDHPWVLEPLRNRLPCALNQLERGRLRRLLCSTEVRSLT